MLSLGILFLGISISFISATLISSKISLEEKILNLINKIATILFSFFTIKLFLVAFEALKKIGV